MIFISPTLFWIFLAIGLVCALVVLYSILWRKNINRVLFQVAFLGFLMFGFTPIFLWLLFL